MEIELLYASLNRIGVFAADIKNAYLQATSSQKEYILF